VPSKKDMKDYPAELKLEAVWLFYAEGRTQAQVAAALGIRDPQRVQKSLRPNASAQPPSEPVG
jgi:DNA-binding transcriptional regulator LsrR (DeoR family)